MLEFDCLLVPGMQTRQADKSCAAAGELAATAKLSTLQSAPGASLPRCACLSTLRAQRTMLCNWQQHTASQPVCVQGYAGYHATQPARAGARHHDQHALHAPACEEVLHGSAVQCPIACHGPALAALDCPGAAKR